MPHTLLPDMVVEFSICQGDAATSVFSGIYVEPFLVRLEALLRGLFVGSIRRPLYDTWMM
jgi:hypothetical protein